MLWQVRNIFADSRMAYDILNAQVNGQLLLVQGFRCGKFLRIAGLQAADVMLPGLDAGFCSLLPLTGQILGAGRDGHGVQLSLSFLQVGNDIVCD